MIEIEIDPVIGTFERVTGDMGATTSPVRAREKEAAAVAPPAAERMIDASDMTSLTPEAVLSII